MILKINRLEEIFNLLVLYFGKISGIIISIYFIPLYSNILGEHEFGIVAVIISLQALLVFMDLGMSTLISTELAEARRPQEVLAFLVRKAERLLTAVYVLALAFAGLFFLFSGTKNFNAVWGVAAIALFGVLVLQNLFYSAMLAVQAYVAASFNQALGSIARAAASAFTLTFISPSLEGFIVSQLIVGLGQLLTTKALFGYKFHPFRSVGRAPVTFQALHSVLLSGLPFMTLSVAGALVLQLDKPLILALISPAAVAPYFLAMTLCMSPVSILGAPVTQYFQPKLLNLFAHGSFEAQKLILRRYTVAITGAIFVPFLIFWNYRATLVNLWLNGAKNADLVIQYTEIILPAVAVGALGFVPFSLLLAGRQYRFQAALSVILTSATLIAVAIAAFVGDVKAICYIYGFYHVSSTLLSWLRTMSINSIRKLGVSSFLTCLLGVTLVLSIQFIREIL